VTVAFMGPYRVELDGGEELGDVAHEARKLPGFGGVLGVVREQLAIFLQRGTASSGVGNDGVEGVATEHRIDVAASQPARILAKTGMQVQSAAATLAAGVTTSQPFFRNTRTVASFSRANETLAMHPARNATRYWRRPSAGNVRRSG